ncbi:hypothetical protein F5X96DRAFT_671116 [Biscogniauxia mediterranea]|nr:hypothetical protein F5X96DRAFT_671116 [Biscogniauxia mediterranea]
MCYQYYTSYELCGHRDRRSTPRPLEKCNNYETCQSRIPVAVYGKKKCPKCSPYLPMIVGDKSHLNDRRTRELWRDLGIKETDAIETECMVRFKRYLLDYLTTAVNKEGGEHGGHEVLRCNLGCFEELTKFVRWQIDRHRDQRYRRVYYLLMFWMLDTILAGCADDMEPEDFKYMLRGFIPIPGLVDHGDFLGLNPTDPNEENYEEVCDQFWELWRQGDTKDAHYAGKSSLIARR